MRDMSVAFDEHPYLSIRTVTVGTTPIYWSEYLTLIWAIEGDVDLVIDNERFTLREGYVDIINPMELRAFYGNGKNRLVIFTLKPAFFANFYEDAMRTYYLIDTEEKPVTRAHRLLFSYLARLYFEYTERPDGRESAIHETLLSLFYHLLNNFHSLYYDMERGSEDQSEVERFHRIEKFVAMHYRERIRLADIAEREFLTPSYLSFKFKDVLGESFQDYLSRIRAEKAAKFLLSTDDAITEIAEEVGFSHLRYFVAAFEKHYGMRPGEYRAHYRIEDLPEEKTLFAPAKRLTEEELAPFLADYSRFLRRSILKLPIDLSREPIGTYDKTDTIYLGDTSLFLEEENMSLVREVQKEIGFRYGILDRLFTRDMDVYCENAAHFINWTRVENILDFVREMDLTPRILTNDAPREVIENFVETFSEIYDMDARTMLLTKMPEEVILPVQQNARYDTVEPMGALFDDLFLNGKKPIPSLVDHIDEHTVLTNDTFFGGGGLYTANSLNKPLFYAWKFASLMGREILIAKKGLMVTKNEDSYQILVYAEPETEGMSAVLNVLGLDRDYHITRFILGGEEGSIHRKWEQLGSPERIDNDHWYLLDEYVHPRMDFFYAERAFVYPIFTKIQKNTAILYLFDEV